MSYIVSTERYFQRFPDRLLARRAFQSVPLRRNESVVLARAHCTGAVTILDHRYLGESVPNAEARCRCVHMAEGQAALVGRYCPVHSPKPSRLRRLLNRLRHA
jgi:hypothetical protein